MRAERLASEAVEVLAAAVVDPAAAAGAADLHDLVRRWFLLHDRLAAFEVFAADPRRDEGVRALLRQGAERDEAFARSLDAAIERARPQPQSNSVRMDVRDVSGGTFQASGRDTYRNSNIEIGGGISLLAVAVIGLLLLAVVVLGFAAQH
ncbi:MULTISPECIES: hypothetical protein [unclassified Actinomadura]|uniref:hypothetical protein n=1 Tax=unclassified Actinomadura TaxID=2626254 RepID=UPI0011EBEE54|nr:hypothetical protein [Actinomadura sp. K4S16]